MRQLHRLRELGNAMMKIATREASSVDGTLKGNQAVGRGILKPRPPHRTCTHRQYLLTCDEYEALLAAARSRCQMCGRPHERLVIDHDHALGQWAVRGLLCTRCNIILGKVEGGISEATAPARRYLSSPWHGKRGWTKARARRMRERVKCTVCGRLVGAMLNGVPYPHRGNDDGLYKDCTGTTVLPKKPIRVAPALTPSGRYDPWDDHPRVYNVVPRHPILGEEEMGY